MALLGKAAVAMWWDMAPEHRVEFEDWHSHEHFPERLGIPGFLRSSRWASAEGGEGFFIMYELEDYDTLVSPHYLARLNAPTPWSSKMMPHHRHMVRSQCRVLESRGGAIAQATLTVRLSPASGADESLREHLRKRIATLVTRPGITAAHLLQTQTPQIAATTEQKIRGGADGAADWILLVSGYDPAVLGGLLHADLGAAALVTAGAQPAQISGLYRLAHSGLAQDIG